MFHGVPEPRPQAEAASLLKSVRTALREVILTSNFGTDWIEKGYPVAKGG